MTEVLGVENEVFGIENLKQVLVWGTDLVDEISDIIKKAKERKGKVTGWAALRFIDNLIQGFTIGGKYKQISLEWLDLSPGEKIQLQRLIQDKLEIQDEFAEEVAERIFYIVLEIGDTITFILSKKK